MTKPIVFFSTLLLAILVVRTEQPAQAREASSASTASVTPAQAQQALEVLQDEKKRAALIETLQTIAQAGVKPKPSAKAGPSATAGPSGKGGPSTSAPASGSPLPLKPTGLGAEILVQLSDGVTRLANEFAATARGVTEFPILWRWLVHELTDPAARAELLDAGWKLALVVGCALGAEWLALRAVRRPLAALDARAPTDNGNNPNDDDGSLAAAERHPRWARRRGQITSTWRLLRRLPFSLGRLMLELLPVAVFAALGNLLLASEIGQPATTRLVILAVVNAYVLTRVIMCAARMLISPSSARTRLLGISDRQALYAEAWVRRIVVVAVFGGAVAEVELLFGLYPAARDALIKLVALIVHLFLVIIVLECRRSVAERIRAPAGAGGSLALLRNWLARGWHYVAIFYIMGLWVVWAFGVRNGYAGLVRFCITTILVVILARLISIVTLGALDRVFGINADFPRRYPRLDQRASRYYAPLRRILSGTIGVLTFLALLQVWGLDVLAWFHDGRTGARLLSALITIAIAAAAAVVVWEGANAAIDRRLERLGRSGRATRLRTLLPLLRTALLVAIATVIGLTALSELGVNIAPLLAGAGIVGVAIGFGSQTLVHDVITGMFLLLENEVQVGDFVTAAGFSGTVENLSIRTIRLRAADGSVNIIPFSAVTTINNSSRGIGNAMVSVTVPYDEDIDRVDATLKEIVDEMRRDPAFEGVIRSDLQLWGLDKVSASGVTIVGQIECTDAGRWPVQREFNRRMRGRFQAQGIAIANP
jgi:moderate conductance mechanosensitive channel